MRAGMRIVGVVWVTIMLVELGIPPRGAAPSLPAGISSDWWATVQANIAASEYHVTWQEKAALPAVVEESDKGDGRSESDPTAVCTPQSPVGFWQAPNRAQNLRTYFTERGPRVIRRTSEKPEWVWGLEVVNFELRIADSEDAPATAAAVQPVESTTVSGNRIEFHRGNFIEWYVNDPKGLEQGFTILDFGLPTYRGDDTAAQRLDPSDPTELTAPAGTPERKPKIILDLAVRGHLIPNMSADGKAIEFLSAGGVGVIHYGQLKAYDAAGRELSATLELVEGSDRNNKTDRMEGNPANPANPVNPLEMPSPRSKTQNQKTKLRIIVEASHALFPVTIDPLATSANWTAESNQNSASFGCSVSTAGDVNGDGYGDVIVGAHRYDNGQDNEGRVFVYQGSASGLSASDNWTTESNQAGALFGFSVSTAGDVNGDGYSDVIVGARDYTNGQTEEGRSYVYYGSASGLSTAANWTAESDQAYARFANAVAAAGDVNGDGYSDVMVGAHVFDNGEDNEGAVFVFHGSAAGLSTTANWAAEGNQLGVTFGNSVAMAGDVNGDGYSDVIVGAPLFDNGQSDEGCACVYYGGPSGLSAAADWIAESNRAYAYFGGSVSTAGDVNGDGYSDVIVGADQYENGETAEGAAFVYYGSASGLSATSDWTAESNQATAYFGVSVATAGDVNGDGFGDVIIGADRYDSGESDEGRAYVYYGSVSGLRSAADWTVESNQVAAYFGNCVASAGDVNGDGYSDVIAGAWYYDNGQTDEGRAFVYYGGPSGLGATTGWTAESNQANAYFGAAVSSAGDVNGDGFCDVIVGAYNYDSGQTDEGRALVFHGLASGLSPVAGWTAESDQAYAAFGYSVAGAGDVNGDGYGDVLIGAHQYDNGQSNEGAVFLWHGSASGLGSNGTPANADWSAESNQAGANFGNAVAAAGDVNGDGYCDGIIGACNYDGGQEDEGRAYVFHGSASGLSTTAVWTVESNQAYANSGNSVGAAGDVNGDGFYDVIVGASYYNNPDEDEGRAYVYHGSASGLSISANWTAEANQTYAYFGRSVAGAGDVNGDGFSDVIVGASGFDNGQSEEGRVFVYHGSATGLSSAANWITESNQTSAWFGASVAGAGDVNSDGFCDVIIGAERYDNGQEDEGRAWVFLGSASGLNSTADWWAESNQSSAYFAGCVAAAGDVNGDGYCDVIIGARAYDNGQNDEGGAFVYFGGGGGGMSLKPRQLRVNSNAPIAPSCNSDSADGVRLAMQGRTPFGRGKVKLECEVKPLGTPFDGSGTYVTSSWEDTGVGGADLTKSLTGLASTTSLLYHWRARLLYHPAALPFLHKSRWLMTRWNGAFEGDFRLPEEAPTAAGVIRFSARSAGNTVTVEWTTAQEVDTVGFFVYCEIAGVRTCITPQILLGSGSAAGHTHTLRRSGFSGPLVPPKGGTPVFWLEEIKTDGRKVFHGPVLPLPAP